MLRQSVNELAITVKILGGPVLLIKDGRFDRDKKKEWIPDKKGAPSALPISRNPEPMLESVVKSLNPLVWAAALEFYLPGSSIRGAWRAHLEKTLRSLDEAPKVCDPLISDEEPGPARPYQACSNALVNDKDERVAVPYHDSCPVCRLFGNTAQASRLSFSDAELIRPIELAEVDNVAISRQTGAVQSPFKAIVLRNAKATLQLRLRNFELWHAGLLGHLFDDLGKGMVPLGSGKNKGWGANTAKATSIRLTYFGKDRVSDGKLRGVGEILNGDDWYKAYGFAPASEPPAIRAGRIAGESALWRHVYEIQDKDIPAFWGNVKPCFNENLWRGMPLLSDRRRPGREAAVEA
jgi:CRISPR/Cas system CSM-associated protein Csm3 (group 7 of RAMP superfamily)